MGRHFASPNYASLRPMMSHSLASTSRCDSIYLEYVQGHILIFYLYYLLQDKKLWEVKLHGRPLDMISFPRPQSNLFLSAISIAGIGIRIYDDKYHVDTISTVEVVSCFKVCKQIIECTEVI